MFNYVKCFWDCLFQKYIKEENLVFTWNLVNLKYSGNIKQAEVFLEEQLVLSTTSYYAVPLLANLSWYSKAECVDVCW